MFQALGFDAQAFAPFLAITVPQLIHLMTEADTLESKRKLDQSLNTIIEQSGALVNFTDMHFTFEPDLWPNAT